MKIFQKDWTRKLEIKIGTTSRRVSHFIEIFSIFTIAAILPSVCNSADWRFAGYTETEKSKLWGFYDDGSILRPTKTIVQVWTRVYDIEEIDRAIPEDTSSKAGQAIAEEGAMRIKRKAYTFLTHTKYYSNANEKERKELVAQTLLNEAVVNRSDVEPYMSMLNEIGCVNRQHRLLDVIAHKNGIRRSSTPNAKFQPLMPDSNTYWLYLTVCGEP